MKAFNLFILALFFILIQACSAPSTKNSSFLKTSPGASYNALTPEELISKARLSTQAMEKSTLYLQAANQYWHNHLNAQSNAALASVVPGDLKYNDLQQYLLLNLKIGIKEESVIRIERTLPLISPQTFHSTSIEQQVRLALLISEAYNIIGQHIQSAVNLIENSGLFAEETYPLIQENIWTSLRYADTSTLGQYHYLGNNQTVVGWLDLARLIQQNQISLETQYQALQSWNKAWPEHPAAINPPHELSILSKLPKTRPKIITLALPLTGPISGPGKAIRDGFLAEYYNKTHDIENTLEIHFFDTNKYNIENLYTGPIIENNLIVGPLDKTSLAKLSQLDHIRTKTLALNYLDNLVEHPVNLFQFGLAPEVETAELAQHLARKKLNKIGIIAPDNDWGLRVYAGFKDALAQENGRLIESSFYQGQSTLNKTVANLLDTESSTLRKRKIERIIHRRLEFLPRRRKDIDAIFMVAKPDIAKQLKPLFSYHYASDLPVFATSQIHSTQATSSNTDIDGIEFTEIPWMLSNTIDIKNQLNKAIPDSNQKYSRFYALGIDAYNLAPRLELLKEIKNSQIQGQTGTLSMNPEGIISRTMEWAKFKNGKVISIKE